MRWARVIVLDFEQEFWVFSVEFLANFYNLETYWRHCRKNGCKKKSTEIFVCGVVFCLAFWILFVSWFFVCYSKVFFCVTFRVALFAYKRKARPGCSRLKTSKTKVVEHKNWVLKVISVSAESILWPRYGAPEVAKNKKVFSSSLSPYRFFDTSSFPTALFDSHVGTF
jgi:hypothetical protein